jgi:3-phenylpropionate/trans-cinnamate dioxygenase ferredoxin subunit
MNEAAASAKKPQKFVVARAEDIPPGSRLIVDVGGREVGIFNIKGSYYGMLNRCPHVGGPLCQGQLVNSVTSTGPGQITLDESQDLLTCPWHNWEFDIRTGQSYWDPKNMRARPFAVNVAGGQEVTEQAELGSLGRVKGPYRAETIEVTVESDYVVLSMRPQRPGTKPSAGACAPPPAQTIEVKVEATR